LGRPSSISTRSIRLVGVLHLLDRLLVLVLGHLGQAPVLQHARVQEVLVDGGELELELLVQVLNDLGVALHGLLRGVGWRGSMAARVV
jgi:hypothetical protein